MEGLKSEAPRKIHRSGQTGKAPTENEFDYSNDVSRPIILAAITYVDDSEVTLEGSTRRLATANRSRVSIHVANLFCQGRWRGRPSNNF